ncbi:MAG: ABC transporter substrate-binding protein [Eubacteriales bacterium]|nr:ABC transporter substrate-binding protein [Eubacteriales bacterium]
MKKLFVLVSVLLLVASFALTANAETPKTYIVGIIQMADNGAFTDMREGYIARMRELGYGEDVMTFDYQNAQGDMTNLASICQAMIAENVDYVVTIATPPSQAFLNMDSGIPQFFISVSNPVGAGLITEMAHPDKGCTGTSNAIPVEEMFKLSEKLTPGCKTYGLIYCTSEINSVTTINNAKAYMDANGLSYVEAVVTNSGEVQQAAQSLVGRVDAMFIPNDSVVQTALTAVAEVAKDAKIPVYGSSAVMVASGAFATISISDTQIGQMTADMSGQFLSGTPIAQIPAVVVSDFVMVINKTTADAIGVTLTDEVLAEAKIIE